MPRCPVIEFVEVFCTNVSTQQAAAVLQQRLLLRYPECRFSFDLEDCDRVLRVACAHGPPDSPGICQVLGHYRFACSVMPD